VVKNIEAYKKSFHAQPDKDTPSLPKASCTQCHDTHAFNVPADRNSAEYAEWRKDVPELCGSCHCYVRRSLGSATPLRPSFI
jgi:hypothetical protein